MSEPASKKEFNLEELIRTLGKEKFSPGHGEKDIEPEIRNRVTTLSAWVQVFELQGKTKEEIEDLKKRGTEALLSRFPDQEDLITELLKPKDKKEDEP